MPVLLAVLGGLGMLWANVAWPERLGGADSFLKLLAIPLLVAQFRRSDRASWPLLGFLSSCAVLLGLYWAQTIQDIVVFRGAVQPVQTVKNATTEMSEFMLCGFALLFMAIAPMKNGRRPQAIGMLSLAAGFLGIVLYVLVLPSRWFAIRFELALPFAALLLLFVLQLFNAKAMLAVLAAGVLACILYAAMPGVYSGFSVESWLGLSRPVYWWKSLRFIADAPIIGHGTGSIRALFELSAAGQTGKMAEIATNPFQETLAVGIQLGAIGIVALWAMWMSHLRLFRAQSLADWIGLVIVIYTIAASMSDSELFDAHRGWNYVFGIGIAGGTVLRARMKESRGQGGDALE